MKDKKIKKKLHKILSLVTDINGIERRKRRVSGNKPTVFVSFSGHIASLIIDLYEKGWDTDKVWDKQWWIYLDTDNTLDEMDKVIKELKAFKRRIER